MEYAPIDQDSRIYKFKCLLFAFFKRSEKELIEPTTTIGIIASIYWLLNLRKVRIYHLEHHQVDGKHIVQVH
jgi:hypothetical protein